MRKPSTKHFLIILIISQAGLLMSQNNSLKLRSTSLSFGFLGSKSTAFGAGACLDLTAGVNKNLFSLYLNGGLELNINDEEEDYSEIGLCYGREINLSNKIKLEGHLGLAYYIHRLKKTVRDTKVTESALGIPIRLKLLHYKGDHFGWGFTSHMNWNKLENLYSVYLIFQYKF